MDSLHFKLQDSIKKLIESRKVEVKVIQQSDGIANRSVQIKSKNQRLVIPGIDNQIKNSGIGSFR